MLGYLDLHGTKVSGTMRLLWHPNMIHFEGLFAQLQHSQTVLSVKLPRCHRLSRLILRIVHIFGLIFCPIWGEAKKPGCQGLSCRV